MRTRNVLLIWVLAALSLSGCDRPKGPTSMSQQRAGELSQRGGNAGTATVAHPLTVDREYGRRQDVSDLALTAPVRLTAIRDAILVGRAIQCWPPTRISKAALDEIAAAEVIDSSLDRAIGRRRPRITCNRPPPLHLPIGPEPIGDNMYRDPLGQFVDRLPVFNLLPRAYEQDEIPFDNPPATMRRRWKSSIRIKAPGDLVMAEALRTVIASEPFIRAVHGLAISISNAQPNALILNESTFLSCPASPLADCPPHEVRRGQRWIDGPRRTRDDLASRLTNGRRTWFDDGSDFSAMVPIWPVYKESGFAVGSRDAIEAAVCVVPNNIMDQRWRRDFPGAAMAMPSYRQQYAILCLLRILGVGGVTTEMNSYPKFDGRNLDLLPLRGPSSGPTVVVGRSALQALDAIYR